MAPLCRLTASGDRLTVQRISSVPALLLSLNNGSDRMINATIRPTLPDTAPTDNNMLNDRRFSSNFCSNYRIMVHIVTAVIVINGGKYRHK